MKNKKTNNQKNYRSKRKMLKSKRAVSPLIATVLLIAFAVALGAVVMNWGRGYVEDTANMARQRSDAEVSCTAEVGLDLVEIDGTPQICYNTTGSGASEVGHIFFILENVKEKEIVDFESRLIGTDTRVPYSTQNFSEEDTTSFYDDDTIKLGANEAQLMHMNYSYATYGEPNQLKITPYIKAAGNTVACSSNSETVTNIKTCANVWG